MNFYSKRTDELNKIQINEICKLKDTYWKYGLKSQKEFFFDKVNQLNGYEFDWKEGIEEVVSKKGHDIGVKAQEVQALYPELVHERDNGYLAVDYVKLTAVLLQAVKELSAKVDELSK